MNITNPCKTCLVTVNCSYMCSERALFVRKVVIGMRTKLKGYLKKEHWDKLVEPCSVVYPTRDNGKEYFDRVLKKYVDVFKEVIGEENWEG